MGTWMSMRSAFVMISLAILAVAIVAIVTMWP